MTDCRHETSLWGSCTSCGLTWEQQVVEQAARLERARDAIESFAHDLRWHNQGELAARATAIANDLGEKP